MLGIKSDNIPITGAQAIQLKEDIVRRSKKIYTPEEQAQLNRENDILKRFDAKWEN